MRSYYNYEEELNNQTIYDLILKIKGEIDTISEQKNLDSDHDLVLASNHLNNFLDALELK